MTTINVGHCTLSDILNDAKNGHIKIPQFQRNFVWSIENSAKLMDSILKGYPAGSLIYWKTKESLRSIRDIGNFAFPTTPAGDYIYYVLDGQQRVTSIIASLTGQKIDDVDYSKIYVNLNASLEEDIVIIDVDEYGLRDDEYITLTELKEFDIVKIAGKYNQSNIKKIQDYSNILGAYEFSKIDLIDAPLDIATEVFTRINTSGKSLSIFEIMCAKMYSDKPAFDLYEERESQRAN